MKKHVVIIAVLALFFLAACAPQEPVAPQLPVGEEPQEPVLDVPAIPGVDAAPAVDDVEEIDDALDATFGARDEEQIITVLKEHEAGAKTLLFGFRHLETALVLIIVVPAGHIRLVVLLFAKKAFPFTGCQQHHTG